MNHFSMKLIKSFLNKYIYIFRTVKIWSTFVEGS